MPQISLARRSYRPVPAVQSQQERTRAVVHVVGCDESSRDVLARWLESVEIETRTHATLAACVASGPESHLGCVLADVASLNEAAILAGVHLPIVATALEADPPIVVKAIRSGALDFIRMPLQEIEVLAAINAAIVFDHQRRSVASRDDLVRDCFQLLSRRERQVMALVTAGKLNKQVAGALGLSEVTVKAHRGAVMRKMSARTFADLVRMADVIGDELASWKLPLAAPSGARLCVVASQDLR